MGLWSYGNAYHDRRELERAAEVEVLFGFFLSKQLLGHSLIR